MNDWQGVPKSPNCVTVFGAGIAGLSAAHELVERGFQVQIWEPVFNSRYPHRGPDIGGLARTQWSSVGWPDERNVDEFKPVASPSGCSAGARTSPIVHLPQKFAFVRDPRTQTDFEIQPKGHSKFTEKAPGQVLREFLRAQGKVPLEMLVRDLETEDRREQETGMYELAVGLRSALAKLLQSSVTVTWQPHGPRAWIATVEVGRNAPGKSEVASPEASPLTFQIHIAPDPLLQPNVNGDRTSADTRAIVHGHLSSEVDSTTGVGGSRVRTDLYWALVATRWDPGTLHLLGSTGTQASGTANLKKVVDEILVTLRMNEQIDYLYVEASDRDFRRLNDEERVERAEIISIKFKELLHADTKIERVRDEKGGLKYQLSWLGEPRVVTLEILPLGEFPTEAPAEAHVFGGFRVRERWLPGEHGYRLFPSSYRHLFDTMRRTPILELEEKSVFSQEQERLVGVQKPESVRYVETGRTVFDNLHATTRHLLAFSNGQRPAVLTRYRVQSFEEVRQYLNIIFSSREDGGFELGIADGMRFNLRVIQYITSCSERRKEYEKVSWWDYLGADSFAPEFGRFIERWPEALVAMDAKTADARSQGNSLIQISLDQVRPEGFRDGTLKGPTSEAWLRHWRRYLEAQGVEFLHGQLKDFRVENVGGRNCVLPVVDSYEPRYPSVDGHPEVMPGYIVLAVSADQVKGLAEKYFEAIVDYPELRAPNHLSDLARASEIDTSELDQPRPGGDFRHFAGIQFYFAEDVFWADGHVYYPDSPWSLSSVSQARFWDDRTDWEHGFRGILSAIVGTWDVPGELIKKSAWNCTEEEIAVEVWHQIRESVEGHRMRRAGRTTGTRGHRTKRDGSADDTRFRLGSGLVDERLPVPLYWHLDEGFEWQPGYNRYKDHSPFHIASAENWQRRPGDPDRGYTVENGIVICGMHTKTRWRIPSMEAANESARHAVNAVLNHCEQAQGAEFRRTLCDVWDPEQDEIADLQWFKDLDRKLCERGLPHLIDILDLERLTERLLSEKRGPYRVDPADILKALRGLVPGALKDRGVNYYG